MKALTQLKILVVGLALSFVTMPLAAASVTIVGWSDVGMHEMDSMDVSVYSLMPPYSTIHAQVISNGVLVVNPSGIKVTYEAVADATGSINTTSQGKGNFYQHAPALYKKTLSPDQGLAGFSMPGTGDQPQAMTFDSTQNCFSAIGIPLTPYDDQGHKNRFPLMRLVARNNSGTVLATTDLAVPVTDEMDCRACHASGSQTAARPPRGWAWEVDPIRDYKMNVLRSHDDHLLGSTAYTQTLSEAGYNPGGLVATVTQDGTPVSCVLCHESGALPGTGLPGARPLTQLMHTKHAYSSDPHQGTALTLMTNSGACFLCHAGPENLAMRGVHHNTINPDGTVAMQCQSCHGSMTAVGSMGRVGWTDEPACQSCHTGTATQNAGALRYTSVFDSSGIPRVPADGTFATPTNSQAGGFELFQHSVGHGGINCAACHGSAHAELVSLQANENVQNQHLQGQAGVLTSCNACHPTRPSGSAGGPHGLHPVDSQWASNHESGRTACQACHGSDYRGTVLSLAQGDRTFSTFGSKHFWPGFQIGCYNCHNGPSSENGTGNTPPVANNASASAVSAAPVAVTLAGTDANGGTLTYQVVTQPTHGTVSISGKVATYFPEPGYIGTDTFSYAVWDGSTDSGLATASVAVNPGECVLSASALVPTADFPGVAVPFRGQATLSACAGAIAYDWDFGDGSPHASGTNVSHTYPSEGDYSWTLTTTSGGTSDVVSGVVTISSTLGPPLTLTLIPMGFMVELVWPVDNIPTSLETSTDLSDPYGWQLSFDPVFSDGVNNTTYILMQYDAQYFRLRRVP